MFLLIVFVFVGRQMTLFSVTGRDVCVQSGFYGDISETFLRFDRIVGG